MGPEASAPGPIRPEPVRSVAHLRELLSAAAALSVLVATSLIAVDGVPTWEADAFSWINRLTDVLEPALFLPMQLGSLIGPALVAILSWVMWRQWRPTLGAALVGVAAWQTAKLVKAGVERGRPSALAPDLVSRWGTPTDGLGFVSGHSAVAFALAAVISPYLGRRWRVVAYGVATLVAVARIHVGAHYPLDTVGGAALGLLLAHLYNAAVGVPRDTRSMAGRTGAAERSASPA